jgi:UDPglucose 6-dehydrogenase
VARDLRLTVLGTGYLGVVHAACLADAGFRVLGVDTDVRLVAQLNAGSLAIHELGLPGMLRRVLAAERLSFTTSYQEAAAFGDVHFVCVGTPQRPDGSADLSQVRACLGRLAPLLARPCLVAGKSTVPAGTARDLATWLARRAPIGSGAELAWNPEFLREGHAVDDTLQPDRIVAGVSSPRAECLLRRVYARQIESGVPFVVTDVATAELVKLAANAFLATKISFINAMAEICEAAGAHAGVLARALGYDPRIGAEGMRPGLGFGGGCLPKDTRSLEGQAATLGAGGLASLLHSVDAINQRSRERMVSLAAELAGGSLDGARVGVLGLSFKPGTDDIRDSPAMEVAATVAGCGAEVSAYDPAATTRACEAVPGLRYAGSLTEAARGADLLLLLTDWPEFSAADPEALGGVVARRAVADGRHALEAEHWRAAGWLYGALGAPPPGDWSGSSGFSMTTKGNGHEHAVASGPGGRLAKFHRR